MGESDVTFHHTKRWVLQSPVDAYCLSWHAFSGCPPCGTPLPCARAARCWAPASNMFLRLLSAARGGGGLHRSPTCVALGSLSVHVGAVHTF